MTILEKDFQGLPILCHADLANNNIIALGRELVSKTRCTLGNGANEGTWDTLKIYLQGEFDYSQFSLVKWRMFATLHMILNQPHNFFQTIQFSVIRPYRKFQLTWKSTTQESTAYLIVPLSANNLSQANPTASWVTSRKQLPPYRQHLRILCNH